MARRLQHLGWYPTVAVAALAFGFFFATQLRTQLIPSSNQVARNEALVSTVQRLERDNATQRSDIGRLRGDIASLDALVAQRSESSRRLSADVEDLRAHAGLTRLHGPGIRLTLANGKAPAEGGGTGYLVSYTDVQDVVNLLFQSGAEGVAVNGRRISPATRILGTSGAVVIDQGPPLRSPFNINAVGNRASMDQTLSQPAILGDLKRRQSLYQLLVSWRGEGDLGLPAYDSALEVGFARALHP
ncbi:MAG: DUF881 domain-containing protein [Candidatus Dormibacteraeota bacterium]|nr:DUF881 domain-containing protein [Candidatus Dormibacteraeota bacterium]